MMPTREQISVAFFDLIAGAADFTATSRRFVHWDQVNETQMPFLTMLKTGEVRGRQNEGLPTLTINAHVFIYMSAGMDPEDTPDTAMNALLDAVDAAVAPGGADALAGNRQTLGGLVVALLSARSGVHRYRRRRRQGRRRDPVPDFGAIARVAQGDGRSFPRKRESHHRIKLVSPLSRGRTEIFPFIAIRSINHAEVQP